jgi:hypothetical protein
MKKLILLITIFMSGLSQQTFAQVSVNVNIGRQPLWGPVGYDYVENYYIPDLNVYYNVPRGVYVYFNNGSWLTSRSLPVAYRNYDLYNVYKVVINNPSPWQNHNYYANRYSGYRGRSGQVVIRNSNDPRYFKTRNYGGYRRDKSGYQGDRKYRENKNYKYDDDRGRGGNRGRGRGHNKD